MMRDARSLSESVAELQREHDRLTSARAVMHARVAEIEATMPELRDLVGEVETRLRAQNAEVGRLMVAAGPDGVGLSGRDYTERTVMMTMGSETVQLSGPRPIGTPRGDLDHARRLYDALEAEAQPIWAALSNAERERDDLRRSIGLAGGEINGIEGQIARVRAAEAERAQLLGEHLTWRSRLAAILGRRRFPIEPPAPSVHDLHAEGLSVRQIADRTGLPKSTVQRQLSGGVPGGTGDLLPGA